MTFRGLLGLITEDFGGRKGSEIEQDYTRYSIPELQEALSVVDETRFPENKAALEAELQARRDSGEFDRFMEETEKARQQRAIDDVNFARKMRKVIAAYLVISALYAFSGITINASSAIVSTAILGFYALLLAATFAGGVGLFLNKPWGHWAAVAVLALQVVKIQVAGFAFSVLSLIGIYVYVAGDGTIGVSAAFDPGFEISTESAGLFWIGINIFVLPMIVYLFTAREDVPNH